MNQTLKIKSEIKNKLRHRLNIWNNSQFCAFLKRSAKLTRTWCLELGNLNLGKKS